MVRLDSALAGPVLHGLWIALTVLATKGVALFAVAYGATRLLRSLSATRRHTVWLLVVLMLAILPAAQAVLPVIHIPFFPKDALSQAARFGSFPFDYRPGAAAVGALGNPPGSKPGGTTAWLPSLLAGAWALVALVFAGRPVLGRIVLGRLERSANHAAAPASVLRSLAGKIGVRRVNLLEHPLVTIPFTFGIFNPRIVLPQAWHTWSSKRLKAVLTHELSHIKRGDSLSNAAAQIVCALLWFNPFIWIARALMLREAELSCDLDVLTNGTPRAEYASTIVEMLRWARGSSFVRISACTLGHRRMVKERIRQILAARPDGQRAAPVIRGRVLIAAFCLLLPLFAVTISLRGQEMLFGTWERLVPLEPVRDLFDRDQYRWNEDGTARRASSLLPDITVSKCVYRIEKEWTDPQGYTWYNLKASWSGIPAPLYMLIRLNPEGDLYEVTDSLTGYPRQFDGARGDEKHKLYWRL